jgi:hypothetical protein
VYVHVVDVYIVPCNYKNGHIFLFLENLYDLLYTSPILRSPEICLSLRRRFCSLDGVCDPPCAGLYWVRVLSLVLIGSGVIDCTR